MENMEQVFEQCQQFEEKRLRFFREVLLEVQKHLDLSNVASYKTIYRELEQSIKAADAVEDLRWFRLTRNYRGHTRLVPANQENKAGARSRKGIPDNPAEDWWTLAKNNRILFPAFQRLIPSRALPRLFEHLRGWVEPQLAPCSQNKDF